MSDLGLYFQSTFDKDEFLSASNESISLAIEYTALDVWANIGKFAPTDHGRLAGSFTAQKIDTWNWSVYTNVEYAMAVHEGTGIYGPEGEEIKPKNAKALKFFWKKTGQTMIFKGDLDTPQEKGRFAAWARARGMTPVFSWVKGMKPRPYAEEAINETSGRTQEFAERAVREIMEGRSW